MAKVIGDPCEIVGVETLCLTTVRLLSMYVSPKYPAFYIGIFLEDYARPKSLPGV